VSYWKYDRSREAPWYIWAFVIAYTANIILFLQMART